MIFPWRIIAKREMLLWLATIEDLKAEIREWKAAADRERRRAEAAINALLARQAGLVLTPPDPKAEKEAMDYADAVMDIFGEQANETEVEKLIEQIQS